MILPLWMLHGLKISKTRKIGLAALFSIAMTDVALDIVRTIFTLSINRHPNASGDTIWNVLEAVIAVVLSSLPTYKSLPGLAKQKKHSSYEDLAQGKCNMTDPKQICRIDDFDILESRLSSAEW